MEYKKHLLIFDTNALYVSYDKMPKFTDFSFSGTFKAFLDEIEQLDIYDIVAMAVPTIVWSEARKQNVEAYNKKVNELETTLMKASFPFHHLTREEKCDYEKHLDILIEEYKNSLQKRQVKVIDIELPSNKRFSSIIQRALSKKPPFEGTNKESDKGFKDALLWESIIEYKKHNKATQIILYTNDSIFGSEELKNEFRTLFNEEIIICGSRTESILHDLLENLAKCKDDTTPLLEQDITLNKLREFLFSNECASQLTWFCQGLIGDNFYIKLDRIEVSSIEDIKTIAKDEILCSDYDVSLKISVFIKTRDSGIFEQEKDLFVFIEVIDDGFKIQSVGNMPIFSYKEAT